jgi:oxygen-independent coproporphyrinogen III oxidase
VTSPAASGLYVHIPFCLTRCGYCDFNTYAGLDDLKGGYVEALAGEAVLHGSSWADHTFVSMFFGGGTPTTLSTGTLGRLIEAFRSRFAFGEVVEATVEANPDTVSEASLRDLRGLGVDRLSIGLQSFDPGVLRALERLHSAESARAAFDAARAAGFDDVNLDLIFGADGETLDSWRATVQETLELCPEHVSAYALTIEPATPLGRAVEAGRTPPPDPDRQADMFELACELLGAAGYEHYEVSNWALPGR